MRVIPEARDGANEQAWKLAKYGTPDERIERIDRQDQEIERLKREKERLQRRLKELEERLERERRAGKRQAAPFSKGPSAASGRRPGRHAGAGYGAQGSRPVPRQVDRVVEVTLPKQCPACGGSIGPERWAQQYQEELPLARPVVTRFEVPIGRCGQCGQRVQGRHPEQTSDALAAAAVQLGPRAVALATQLNKTMGTSMAKTAAILQQVSGIRVTPGGVSQLLDRVARKASPTYDALVQSVQRSPVVAPDETGWRVSGESWWLWTFVGAGATVYRIQPGRSYEVAASVLGPHYAGVLERRLVALSTLYGGGAPNLHGPSSAALWALTGWRPRWRAALSPGHPPAVAGRAGPPEAAGNGTAAAGSGHNHPHHTRAAARCAAGRAHPPACEPTIAEAPDP